MAFERMDNSLLRETLKAGKIEPTLAQAEEMNRILSEEISAGIKNEKLAKFILDNFKTQIEERIKLSNKKTPKKVASSLAHLVVPISVDGTLGELLQKYGITPKSIHASTINKIVAGVKPKSLLAKPSEPAPSQIMSQVEKNNRLKKFLLDHYSQELSNYGNNSDSILSDDVETFAAEIADEKFPKIFNVKLSRHLKQKGISYTDEQAEELNALYFDNLTSIEKNELIEHYIVEKFGSQLENNSLAAEIANDVFPKYKNKNLNPQLEIFNIHPTLDQTRALNDIESRDVPNPEKNKLLHEFLMNNFANELNAAVLSKAYGTNYPEAIAARIAHHVSPAQSQDDIHIANFFVNLPMLKLPLDEVQLKNKSFLRRAVADNEIEKDVRVLHEVMQHFILSPPKLEIMREAGKRNVEIYLQQLRKELVLAIIALDKRKVEEAKEHFNNATKLAGIQTEKANFKLKMSELHGMASSFNLTNPTATFEEVETLRFKVEIAVQELNLLISKPVLAARNFLVMKKDTQQFKDEIKSLQENLAQDLIHLGHLQTAKKAHTVGNHLIMQLASAEIDKQIKAIKSITEIAGFSSIKNQRLFINAIIQKFPNAFFEKDQIELEKIYQETRHSKDKSAWKAIFAKKIADINSRPGYFLNDVGFPKWVDIIFNLCASPKDKPGNLFNTPLPDIKLPHKPGVLNLANAFSEFNINDALYVSAKSGGKNKAGEYGANYVLPYVDTDDMLHVSMIFFKQAIDGKKINQRENIAETFAAGVLNSVVGELAAPINLAMSPAAQGGTVADPDNVYVGSVFLQGFIDSKKAAYQILEPEKKTIERPSSRTYNNGEKQAEMKRFQQGFKLAIEQMHDPEAVKESMGEALMASMLVGNFQTHSENTGFAYVGDGDNKQLRFVILDFGGATRLPYTTDGTGAFTGPVSAGRFERSFDPSETKDKKYAISYFDDYPIEITHSESFLKGAEKVAGKSRVEIANSVTQNIKKIIAKYGVKAFVTEYASTLDTTANSALKKLLTDDSKAEEVTIAFLKDAMFARQFSVKKYVEKIRFKKSSDAQQNLMIHENAVLLRHSSNDIFGKKIPADYVEQRLKAPDAVTDTTGMHKLLSADIVGNANLKDIIQVYCQRLTEAAKFDLDPELEILRDFLSESVKTYRLEDLDILAMACDEARTRLVKSSTLLKAQDDEVYNHFMQAQQALFNVAVTPIPVVNASPQHSPRAAKESKEQEEKAIGGISADSDDEDELDEEFKGGPALPSVTQPLSSTLSASSFLRRASSPASPFVSDADLEGKYDSDAKQVSTSTAPQTPPPLPERRSVSSPTGPTPTTQTRATSAPVVPPPLPPASKPASQARPPRRSFLDSDGKVHQPEDNKHQVQTKTISPVLFDKFYKYAQNVSQFFKEDRAAQQSLSLFAHSRVPASFNPQHYPAHVDISRFIEEIKRIPTHEIAIPENVMRSKPLDKTEFSNEYKKVSKNLPAANLEADIDAATKTLKNGQYAINYLISQALAPEAKRQAVETAACYVENREKNIYRSTVVRLSPAAVANPTQDIPGTTKKMCSDEYLKIADAQITSFIAEVGSHKTVRIRPSTDPNMVQAYILVCMAKGLTSKIHQDNYPLKFDVGAEELAVVNQRIREKVLSAPPKIKDEDLKLLRELVQVVNADSSLKELTKDDLSTIDSKLKQGFSPGPEDVRKIVDIVDKKLKAEPAATPIPLSTLRVHK
jgi:hypothetical protein